MFKPITQIFATEWLHEIVHDAASQRPAHGADVSRAREYQRIQCRGYFTQAWEQVQSVDVWQSDVEQDQVRSQGLRSFQSSVACRSYSDDVEPGNLADVGGMDPGCSVVIVDNQDVYHCGALLLVPLLSAPSVRGAELAGADVRLYGQSSLVTKPVVLVVGAFQVASPGV